MGTLWNIIIGLGGGLLKVIVKILEMMRDKQLVEQGRALAKAEQDRKDSTSAKIEIAVIQEQEQILMNDASKEDLAKKMNEGKF